MSEFSNPASGATAEARAYVARLLELLGDRDPLAVQEELPGRLREAVAGLDGEALCRPEAPGKWSVLQVLGHLADTEVVYRYRMRMNVSQPGSAIPAYDQELWADRLHYDEADLEATLNEIEVLRAANLRWLRSLGEEELDRAGVHEERGTESVRRIAELLAAHDIVHLRQIERIRAAIS